MAKKSDLEIQMQERFERVGKLRWNKWYKKIRTIGLSRYLKGKEKENRLTLIARFRLGSEIRKGRYWEGEENRRCRICGWVEESWEHVVEVCIREGKGGGREEILEILEDDGREKSCMRKLLSRRREKEKKGGRTDGDRRTMVRQEE